MVTQMVVMFYLQFLAVVGGESVHEELDSTEVGKYSNIAVLVMIWTAYWQYNIGNDILATIFKHCLCPSK